MYGHPEWPAAFQYEAARIERAVLDGEPLVLGFTTRRGREALEQVLRFEEQDGRIARMRGYAFCPETMREVGEALGLPRAHRPLPLPDAGARGELPGRPAYGCWLLTETTSPVMYEE